jgi:transcription initiation factor TFIIF subunit beta
LPDNETTATIPKEYNINFISTDVQNKFVFSQSDHGKAISGTVYHEGVAVPTETNAYRNIMRKRVMEAGTPQRTTQVLGQNNQPIFVPGASSTVPTSDFADFVVSLFDDHYFIC